MAIKNTILIVDSINIFDCGENILNFTLKKCSCLQIRGDVF